MDLRIDNLLRDIHVGVEEIKNSQKPSEDFNIFATLGIEALETRHSKFLAELLNPSGSHGCGDLFLEHFLLLEPLQSKIETIHVDMHSFCKRAKVETEQFHLVEKNLSYIDIAIESGNTAIVIENKIYAPDQHKQLYRYYKAKANEKFSNIIIIYLTLDGKMPSEQSLHKCLTSDDIELLSYETHIYDWLLKAIEKVEFENIKIILNQYLTTLEKLSNKNSKKENNAIADILMQKDNLQTAISIANALPRAKAMFEMQFYKELQDKLSPALAGFENYNGEDFYWNFDEDDIEWIMGLRKPNSKRNCNGFVGLYWCKELTNGAYLFLQIGHDYEFQLYCECFLCAKKSITTILRIKKTKFKETRWLVQDNNKILIEGEDFPVVYFGKDDSIYKKSTEEIKRIINEIVEILDVTIQSNDFKKLENIMKSS
ncbi:MAG: PD-(D/E)XK nuclease family protein [Campylobacterales bacterium]|nr:PD-(D/E)XK nuclease family protein [Campylobacterales bacterium]